MGILRKLFGPSQTEVWQQLSTELGARYVEGSFFKNPKVQVAYGEWTITLDSYTAGTGSSSTLYTRFRAPYVNPDGFRFALHRSNFIFEFAKKFGMQDAEVGYPEFDRHYIIKGNNEEKLRALFANDELRTRLQDYPDVGLCVLDSDGDFGPTFPPDTDELVFIADYTRDIPRLKQFFDLFAVTLDQLCHIGSAYEKRPRVKL